MWERLPAAIVDTHLGFDLPFRARIKRRRRGPDFFVNFERALMPALDGKDEPKGYLILEFEAGALPHWTFHELPSRPMRQLALYAAAMSGPQIQSWIQSRLYGIPADSVVRLKVCGKISAEAMAVFRAPALRELVPETVNIEAVLVDNRCDGNRR